MRPRFGIYWLIWEQSHLLAHQDGIHPDVDEGTSGPEIRDVDQEVDDGEQQEGRRGHRRHERHRPEVLVDGDEAVLLRKPAKAAADNTEDDKPGREALPIFR